MALSDPALTRRIRTMIPDTDAVFGAAGDEYLFDDDQIEDFYIEGNSNVKYAAGLAKWAIGSSEALILKVITNYETKTDGASLAKQWLAMGAAMIEEAKLELDSAAEFFDIIPFCDPTFLPEGYPYRPYSGGPLWG